MKKDISPICGILYMKPLILENKMDIEFELADVQDAEKLMEIKKLAFYDDVKRYGECPSFITDVKVMVEKIKTAIYYKILAGGEIIGGMEIYKREESHYHLYMLCVHPDYHDKGIGTRALRFMFDQHPDALLWTLVTPKDNARNCHLYEKMGFINANERKMSDALTLIRYERRSE